MGSILTVVIRGPQKLQIRDSSVLRTVQWGWVGLGWAGGLMQEQALGCGPPSLPHHEAELPDCPVPRPSGLSTATRPHRSAGGRKIPSSCV